ncbi:uncharacterized protein si:cabz01007807.1 isoform X2 [Boleophthalmus pectinirostris]|uniref:uncharacterized protein si:cabz01007807.1 isoform X2 n=1 Tax=Boleophthalmus pectinirostris TaxID=150288 RepID=UPI00242B6B55|nr:uncharacterized protein si:cabz01007807.1 isoform X2 [Boleophthalmus pectinirostris]
MIGAAMETVEENGGLNEPTSLRDRRPSGLLTMDKDLSAATQNGVHKPSANPFYSYYLESTSPSEENSTETSTDPPNMDSIFGLPPESQSSLMDSLASVGNQSNLYPQNDFLSVKPTQDIFLKSKLSPDFHDVTLDSPDLFRTTPPSALLSSNKSDTEDLIVAAHSKEVSQSFNTSDSLFHPTPSSNPFYSTNSSNYDKENQSPASVKSNDIFSTNANEKLDIFSPSSLSSVDPFPSQVTRDIDFSSLEDPFADSPLKFSDPFQNASLDASDVSFSPKANNAVDTVKVPPSRPKPPRPTPPVRTPKATSPLSDKPKEIVLTTPQGSQHSILQPTPFVQANSPSESPSQSPKLTNVTNFRRPPKPLPRIRRSRPSVTSNTSNTSNTPNTPNSPNSPNSPNTPLSPTSPTSPSSPKPTPPIKPPKPQRPSPPVLPALPASVTQDVSEPGEAMKSPEPAARKPPKPPAPKLSPKLTFKKPVLQKPVIRRKHKDTDKVVDPSDYVAFENILLIGQEHCVEDWPEDSPEVQPDFKPRGTLRLRRESLMNKTDSDNEDLDELGSSTKKKDRKFSLTIGSRRDSKDRFSDECSSSRSRTSSRKSSREYFTDSPYSSQEFRKDDKEDPDQWVDYKKPHFKDKVNSILRRSSAAAVLSDQKHMNGNVPHESKTPEFKKSIKDSFRRHSEGAMIDAETEDDFESKKSRKLKSLKFLPNIGFGHNKNGDGEPKGAHGYTPQKGSKEDLFGTHTNFSTRSKSMDDGLEEMKSQNLHPLNKAGNMNGAYLKKSKTLSPTSLKGYEEDYETDLSSPQQDYNGEFEFEDIDALKGKQALSPTEMNYYEEDEFDAREQKKPFKIKAFKKLKTKSKSMDLLSEDPPGATSSDYMSEAARAEFMAAEKDKRAMDDFDEGDADGDTDSLMEWWNTVEQWDEVPSDEEEMALQEDESKSFSILADKVRRGLRLFNKVFMERAETLWQSVISLHTIADDISTFHSKARIAGITGGTTTAVGGVAAIAGLALAPVTFGASLVVTAVGVGVATAGGITSASAAISDNVNNANDRKKVEALLLDNEVHLMELSKILHFSNTGLYKLRGHPFLRSGTQHYSQDWEVRRDVQMISLVDTPVMKATDFIDSAVTTVQSLFQGMDKYFLKDGTRELKKGCKKEIVGQIKDVASVLNDCIVELNAVREELHDAIGEV